MADQKDNIFQYVNSRMFSVLSGKDRAFNYDLLSFIYDTFTKYEHRTNIFRDELSDRLTDYIKERNYEKIDDDEGNSLSDRTPRDKALYKIRQYISCGWLEEDTSEGFATVVSLTDSAIALMNTLRSIIDNTNNPIEYTGYFYMIHEAVIHFDFARSKAFLEQIAKNTRELFNSLQGLNSSIKRFIERLIDNRELTPREILDTLLYKYQDQVILSVFNNLKGKDNPSKFTSDIIEGLKLLRMNEDNMKRMIRSCAGTTGNDYSLEALKRQELFVEETLDEVISRSEEVDDFIRIIDNKNTKFHTSAVARLNFLMNSRQDIEGLVIKAMRALRLSDPESEFENIIPIFYSDNLDDRSLFTRSFNRDRRTSVTLDEGVSASKEEIEEAFSSIQAEDQFSGENINAYVDQLLGHRDRISSKEIETSSIEDLIRLMAIQVYCSYSGMCYEVEFSDDIYLACGYLTKSFEIIRKRQEEKKQ
ncbi:MAG: hypothetical protein IJ831_05970 [Spirochaetales bacterium]|nr:hypothetical protein [Spirochaetales bacterium]